ncbi:MAG: FAD-dependent oxidoreductase [archaeon]
MEKNYDVVILGAGPAGLSSGIYAARFGLKTLVISRDIGGMMNMASLVENYPGFRGSGIELAMKMSEQAKNAGAEMLQRNISNITKQKNSFKIQTDKNEIFDARALIITLGTEKRKLNIDGEDKFLGRGVSYCATCDAPLFKGKVTVVVGGRNSAAHAALLLARYAKKVYIVYRQGRLNCDTFLLDELNKNKSIEIVYNSLPARIKGQDSVTELIVSSEGSEKSIRTDGIFVEIGSVPLTSLAKNLGLSLDEAGYILADDKMNTNVTGIYVAGDIVAGSLKQMIVASGQGAIAASSAYNFLKDNNKSDK